MCDSYTGQVGRTLELLKLGLGAYVAARINQSLDSGHLTAECVEQFVERNKLPSSAVAWDAHGLLRFIEMNWYQVFRQDLDERWNSSRPHIFELIDIRNRWAHQEPISADDAHRAADTAMRLLQAVESPQADAMRALRAEMCGCLTESAVSFAPLPWAAEGVTAALSFAQKRMKAARNGVERRYRTMRGRAEVEVHAERREASSASTAAPANG